jgi:hypothetical protein
MMEVNTNDDLNQFETVKSFYINPFWMHCQKLG